MGKSAPVDREMAKYGAQETELYRRFELRTADWSRCAGSRETLLETATVIWTSWATLASTGRWWIDPLRPKPPPTTVDPGIVLDQ